MILADGILCNLELNIAGKITRFTRFFINHEEH